MGIKKRSARVMLEALLYDATTMLHSDVSPKTVHEFLTNKLARDFKGSTWWKVDWTGKNSYAVIATIKFQICPICNQAKVDQTGVCQACDAKCSKEDLIAINEVERDE